MDSELESESQTNTNTQSSYESLVFSKDDSLKSPESSDCEGYATPLASSLTDLTAVTINLPDGHHSDDEKNVVLSSGELTPVSSRAISPPIIRETLFLQKPKILVMTQRMLSEEDIRKVLEESRASSEDEFFDVAESEEDKIRGVAQQFLDGVDLEEEVPVVVAEQDAEPTNVSGSRSATPVLNALKPEGVEQSDDVESVEKNVAGAVGEEEVMEVDQLEKNGEPDEVAVSTLEAVLEAVEATECVQKVVEQLTAKVEEETVEDDVIANNGCVEKESMASEECKSKLILENEEADALSIEKLVDEAKKDIEAVVENGLTENVVAESSHSYEESNSPIIEANFEDNEKNGSTSSINKEDGSETASVKAESSEETNTVSNVQLVPELKEGDEEIDTEVSMVKTQIADESVETETSVVPQPVSELNTLEDNNSEVIRKESTGARSDPEEILEADEIRTTIVAENVRVAFSGSPANVSKLIAHFEKEHSSTPSASPPSPLKEVTEQLEVNQEAIETTLPTPINTDEVKTLPPPLASTNDEYLSDVSANDEKNTIPLNYDADADDANGYSSGDEEESLSSSTSSESFEFAESVPSPTQKDVQDEKATQALRNSIIERYPSHETDDDELDVEEFDDDLLAVKQISAEVEQLVAAINAFGRDEEQQMSAYLVGKNMAAEKRKKSAIEANRTDQLVQTNYDDFILVDKHNQEVMESLQVEINRLQADLDKVKFGEKELLRINAKLQEDLNESQQTIDGIEVEAEQQYTELTSEIDELCEIVLKKDQELAALKEKVANLSVSEINLKDDVDAQRVIVQRQKEIIEGLREELDNLTKKLGEVSKSRDKAIEDATIYKMKNMERDRFLSKEAQMSMEIEDLQRELNKQKLILNNTSMAKLADTFDRKVLHLENELRERDMLICKQNQIINSHRKSPTGSIITTRKMQPRASVLAAAGNLPSAGSSSESFQNGLDVEAKEALLSFILSDRHNQLANMYNIGRILDLTAQEERAIERHLTKDRFT